MRRIIGTHFVGDTYENRENLRLYIELNKNIIMRLLFGNREETDRQSLPAVDGNNGERQVDQFFVGKLLAYAAYASSDTWSRETMVTAFHLLPNPNDDARL